MCKKLREFGSLDNVPFDVTKNIVAKSLDDLGNIEESDVNRVTLQCPHSILYDEGVVAISRQEVSYSSYWIHRSPVEEVLSRLETFNSRAMVTSTFSWKETSVGKELPKSISSASALPSTL